MAVIAADGLSSVACWLLRWTAELPRLPFLPEKAMTPRAAAPRRRADRIGESYHRWRIERYKRVPKNGNVEAMRRTFLAISLAFVTACAGSYKASYVAGAVTKQLATESYDVYSAEFNKKATECDPQTNESITTKTELDECMGKAYAKPTHDKIKVGVAAYHEAAKAHTNVMVAVDGSAEERKAATQAVLESAIELLSLFPNGEKLVKKLKSMTGAK